MLFNSIEFAIFLPIIFILYWFVAKKNLKIQNTLLVIASYFFYGWWDWRFLSLIIFSSFVDYLVGIGLSKSKTQKKRKVLLLTSIFVNLGFLGIFKYFNFFAVSFADAFTLLGQSIEPTRLNIILPVGISFYTFQTLSYSIDVYKRKLEPTKDIIAFFAYVSFFPQLVAGPIERATNFLPQFYKKRKFCYEQASDGVRQILWGLFKKIVIADTASFYVNDIFSNHTNQPPIVLITGAVLFAFQIYGDFSGYSDIAIGTARLFGFNLMKNFSFPYFSRDIAEFWRRWHISLSSWFRDYLYFPLGGSQGSKQQQIRNTFIIFIVSGFWHGANWTFIVWGTLNALYFLPLLLSNKNRKNLNTAGYGSIKTIFIDIIKITSTFTLTTFTWIFFRAESMAHALSYIKHIFIPNENLNSLGLIQENSLNLIFLFAYICFLVTIEWIQRNKNHGLECSECKNKTKSKIKRGLLYIVIVIIIILNIPNEAVGFIYFQF